MKKLYSAIMLLAMMVAALSLTACGGDDEDENEASVVGTWEVTYVKASSSYDMDDEEGLKIGDQMTFYSDGRYKDSEDTGRWTKKGNTLTVTVDDDFSIPAVMTITKLTDRVLEVKLDYGSFIQFEIKMKRVITASGDDDEGVIGGGGSSPSSTLKMVSSKGGEYYVENGKEDYSIGSNRGNLSERGHIWCYLRASKRDEANNMASGYFRIKLGNKKSISDFPIGYDLGEVNMNFATFSDYSYTNEFNYASGSIKVIANDGKSFTLKFDNYVAKRSSGWTMTVNGTLYVEEEKSF